jgi:hypothetical protein
MTPLTVHLSDLFTDRRRMFPWHDDELLLVDSPPLAHMRDRTGHLEDSHLLCQQSATLSEQRGAGYRVALPIGV